MLMRPSAGTAIAVAAPLVGRGRDRGVVESVRGKPRADFM